MKKRHTLCTYLLGFIMLFSQYNVQASSSPIIITPPNKSFSINLTDDFKEVYNEDSYMYYTDNINYVSINLYKENKKELRQKGINSLKEYKDVSMEQEELSKTNNTTNKFKIISTSTNSKGYLVLEATYTMNKRSDFYSKYSFIEGKDSYYLLVVNTMGSEGSNASAINNIIQSFKELTPSQETYSNINPQETLDYLNSLKDEDAKTYLNSLSEQDKEVLKSYLREDLEKMKEFMKKPTIEQQNIYRPSGTTENIGLKVDPHGYSKYDENIQTMSDLENIEEFRRKAKDDENEDITKKVIIIASIIIILLAIKQHTSKETKENHTIETNSSTQVEQQAKELPSFISEVTREEITNPTIPKVGDNLNSQQSSWFTKNAWWIALAIAIFLFKMCSEISH